ncbi:MAG: hypothetical protein ABSA83_22695 [Verrucomicrobiota bacterium]
MFIKCAISNNFTSLTGVSNITVGLAPMILDTMPWLEASNSPNGRVTLMWPRPATGFNHRGTTNLSPENWNQITNAVMNTNGILQVTLPATNAN